MKDLCVHRCIQSWLSFTFDFRGEKITKLCQVMGMDMPYDPDDTYELTTDNVKKIMAIYMRFRYKLCQITFEFTTDVKKIIYNVA